MQADGSRVVTGPTFGRFGGVSQHVRALAAHSRHRPRVFRLPPWSLWHPAWSRWLWRHEAERRRLPDPFLVREARRAADADLLHLHAYPHWRDAYFRPENPDQRFVYSVHQLFEEQDFAPEEWPRWRAFREGTLEACRGADAVIAVAPWLVPRLAAQGVRAVHVPNAVDVDALRGADADRFRDRFRIRDDYVLYAAAFLRYKRPGLFLEAAEAMPDKRFVMVGRGATRDAARKLHGRPLPPNLLCFGELPREMLLDCMAGCRVLALPSSNETFPTVLLEAMAMGRPVVGAANAGPKDIIEDRKTGFLFRPDDAASFRDAVAAAWDAPEAGAAARALVEREYDWARVAERVDRLYDDVLSKGGRP